MTLSYDDLINLKKRSEVSTLLEESYSAGLYRGGRIGAHIRDTVRYIVEYVSKAALSTAAFISGIIIGIIGGNHG
jgi:hypothetical protein